MSSGSMIRVGIAAAVAAALMCGTVSPASAAEPGSSVETPVVGGFGLGDRLEGLIDAQTGDFSFTVPVAGLELAWSSRGGLDRFSLGDGWAIAGVSQLDVDGGVRVFPAAGDVYEADASAPSGLHGYTLADLSFSQDAGVLPARGDGLAGEREYAYRLSELGGVVTYFDALGDPVATIDPHGLRRDWAWADRHRLERIVSEAGVVTEVDWADASELKVTTQAGGSAAAGAGTRTVVSGVVEFGDDGVSAIVDAVGARTGVTYDPDGSVIRLDDASGAETAVTWQHLDDGRTVVERVAVAEPGTGRELSARTWAPVAAGPTGWPVIGESSTSSALAEGPGYRTVLSDGVTQVESTYTASHLMTSRDIELVTPNGSQVVQSQTFAYPGGDASGDGELPGQGHRPSAATTTYRDAAGAERSISEKYAFDDFGRVTRAVDGTHYAYDAANRQIGEVTPDGTVVDTAYWATGDRRSLSTTDVATGAPRSTDFYWADGALVNDASTGEGRTETASYLLTASGRHARSVAGSSDVLATSYSTHDRHGNVTELTGADGAVTERYRYSDYGVTEQVPAGAPVGGERMLRVGDATYQPFRFAGEYANPTPARTQHLMVREYDADTMRFTREDPELLHNRFAFSDLNPITKVDPSGRTPTFDSTINWVFAGVGFGLLVIGVASAGGMLAAMAPFLSAQAVAVNAVIITAAGLTEAASVGAAVTQLVDDYSPDFTLTDEQRQILGMTEMVGAAAGAALGVGSVVALRASYKVAGVSAQKMVEDLDTEFNEYLVTRRAGDESLSSHPVLKGYRGSVSKAGGAKYANATDRFDQALRNAEDTWINTPSKERTFFANRKLVKAYNTNLETMESYAAGLKQGIVRSIGTDSITAETKSTLDTYLFALSETPQTYPTLARLLSSGL